MDITKAILDAKEQNIYFRPVKWRGSGQAFCVHAGETHMVPGCGSRPFMMTYVDTLTADWETLTPDELYLEAER